MESMVTKELTVMNEIEMTTLREIIPQDSPVHAIIAEKLVIRKVLANYLRSTELKSKQESNMMRQQT